MSAREFFTEEERAEIENAITEAEKVTSGEIRVHLENTCDEKILDHTSWIFEELKMHATEKRNGVLIYMAVEDKAFAIIGDAGINLLVPTDFWENIKDEMRAAFKQDRFKEGLVEAINTIGLDLKAHFPIQEDDENELPNTISYGDDEKE
ncbi:MAG TPA: hypothetical protein DHU89_00465 [Flavobacteriales bacterium]|nr:hypothetical protein [Flavobacteriales bacterium]|tara:strand:- start:2158 stop:2607 length:450 start_codon:yes stop_codon:yes gene_type:complete